MFLLNFDEGVFSFEQLKYQPQSKRCGELQSFNMFSMYIMLSIFGFLHISKSFGISDITPLQKNTKLKYVQWLENSTKLVAMKSKCHWKIKMQFTMDHTNVEWLD